MYQDKFCFRNFGIDFEGVIVRFFHDIAGREEGFYDVVKINFGDPALDDCGFEALLPVDEIPNANEDNASEVIDQFKLEQKIKALVRKIKADERRVTLSLKYTDAEGNIIAPLPEDIANKKEQTETETEKTD